jgi:hypothetical protein
MTKLAERTQRIRYFILSNRNSTARHRIIDGRDMPQQSIVGDADRKMCRCQLLSLSSGRCRHFPPCYQPDLAASFCGSRAVSAADTIHQPATRPCFCWLWPRYSNRTRLIDNRSRPYDQSYIAARMPPISGDERTARRSCLTGSSMTIPRLERSDKALLTWSYPCQPCANVVVCRSLVVVTSFANDTHMAVRDGKNRKLVLSISFTASTA